MAVVSTSFTITGSTTWATSTWADNDSNPSFKVDAQLQAWVTAINDTSKIEIVKTPGNATARGATDLVQWVLRCRDGDTSSDFGFNFCYRAAGAGSNSSTSNQGMYYARTDSSSNNGFGTYTGVGTSYYSAIADPMSYLTAYEATGSTPWFAFPMANSNRTVRHSAILLRLDTTNLTSGSYFPSSGFSKWLYFQNNQNTSNLAAVSSHSSIAQPYKGTGTNFQALQIETPSIDNYFFPIRSQYGKIHWMGQPTKDILISASSTGVWGDTVQISSIVYTCIGSGSSGANFWVKTSTV